MTAALALPPSLATAWHLSDAVLLASTPSSHVWRALSAEHGRVVVKQLKPEGHGERAGIDFLAWRDGHSTVRLFARMGDACLLADAGETTLRDFHRANGDVAATEIIVSVLAGLHAPSHFSRPATLMPLPQHLRPLFDLAATATRPDIADLAGWAAGVALDLLAHQQDIKPLHGDLHHDNIIGSPSGGWLAIDPHGLLGDPAYDVANVFGNPLDARDIVLDPARALRLAARFSETLGRPARTILQHAAVHAMLSVAWTLSRDLTASGAINLDERLAFARIAQTLLADKLS